jgi:hypothetical protein
MSYKFKWAIYCILGFVLLVSAGCSNNNEQATQHRIQIENSKPVVWLIDDKLCEMYRKNELKAQSAFENKVIVVIGDVVKVGSFEEQPDLLYVELDTLFGYKVLAQFRDLYKKDLEKLIPGKGVEVKGECILNKEKSTIYIEGARIIAEGSNELSHVPEFTQR